MSNLKPKVSILLPCLNTCNYLKERFQSIFSQTLVNWELIIVDSYSDDGSWELIQYYAARDKRIRAFQAPRQGVYAGLNHCIEESCGEYVYIAMSDDTMEANCLELMVQEMDAHPECDICHTCLKVIDEYGGEIKDWWSNTPPVIFYGDLIKKKHIRMAPYDGVLYLVLKTVYVSLTQLLVRRHLFEKVGFFRTDFGPEGDFEWAMRAALLSNVLHIPETVATWRIHPKQLTQKHDGSEKYKKLSKMANSAISILKENNLDLYRSIYKSRLIWHYEHQGIFFELSQRSNEIDKAFYLLQQLITTPIPVLALIKNRVLSRILKKELGSVEEALETLHIANNISLLDTSV